MKPSLWTTVATLMTAVAISQAQNLFVAAPNTLRMGAEETVAIFLNQGTQDVKICLMDYPGKKKEFSIKHLRVSPDKPTIVNVTVNPDDIPDLNLISNNDKNYVLLVITAHEFLKEVKILVSPFSGYVFLQTDKPIYTPIQTVNIRILKLDETMSPDNQSFTLQIRNPQNVIMENIKSTSKDLTTANGIYNYVFSFPKHPMKGIWSAVVFYGLKVPKNDTVTFEVAEYILPTFEVKVMVPDYILPDDKMVTVSVEATYVYGQKVEGFANFKLSFKPDGLDNIIHFGNKDRVQLFKGHAEFRYNTDEIRNNEQVGWFPNVQGGKMIVEAVITESTTGDKETRSESSTIFATSPYLISFKKCLNDYRAGLPTIIEAEIHFVNGKPASGVPAEIQVQDDQGNNVHVQFPVSISSETGKLVFFIKAPKEHKHLKIMITTKNSTLNRGSQAEGKHTMFAYVAKSNNYIALARTDQGEKLQVNRIKTLTVYSHPDKSLPLFYLITSQGRIVDTGSIISDSQEKSISIDVKSEMVPSIRITLFAHNGNELLADSIKFDVVHVCSKRAQINVSLEFEKQHPAPGMTGNIIINGAPSTAVSVLAVDKAIYVLRDKDLLTKEKMFREMEGHDLGCGPGGGLDTQMILENAGLVIVTNQTTGTTERKSYSCMEKKRRKREIREQIHEKHGNQTMKCCELGTRKDKLGRSCEQRALIILTYQGEGLENRDRCGEIFRKCCELAIDLYAVAIAARQHGVPGPAHTMVGSENPFARTTIKHNELGFVDDDELNEREDMAIERKDFRETWLFEIALIGPDGHLKIPASLPHSITTWVVQAVSVSPKFIGGGMCVADPKTVVASKSLFMQVKMPYSVVRNEQIEIPITVFNYAPKKQAVVLYFYGLKDLCSDAQPNEKSAIKRIWVGPNSSAYTSFPMVPLEAKEYPIKFVASSVTATDVVIKSLNVVPEGQPREEDIVFIIDPSNTQKRKRRNIVNEKYTLNYDDEIKQQLSIVTIEPDIEYVPGTESCYITAIGDKFGATIHTSLANPDRLIRMPQGCGEQNMALMAPTLYTIEYLKVTGKLTAAQEGNGYKFIREGYKRQQSFRKSDGSFAAWPNRPSSTWLTAFVAKVFCQADKYIFIDSTVVCSALTWLSQNQLPDGSFTEKYAIIHREMMGGVSGNVPLTAFVLLAFEKCKCSENNVTIVKEKAVNFLTFNIPQLTDPYQLSIATYALAVANPDLAREANSRLLELARHDEGLNHMFWGNGKSGISLETTSYALQTQLIYGNMDKATSIVNWMNTQRTVGGAFYSTQDTIAAIEALSQYSIISKDPDVSLVCNLTSSNDPTFNERIEFKPANARIMQAFELNKLGGRVFVESQGSGISTMGVKLRYNTPVSQDKLCKFDLTVNVSDAKEIKKEEAKPATDDELMNLFPQDLIIDLEIQKEKDKALQFEERLRGLSLDDIMKNPVGRIGKDVMFPPKVPLHHVRNNLNRMRALDIMKRANHRFAPSNITNLNHRRPRRNIAINPNTAEGKSAMNSKYILNVTICTRYLSNGNSNMAVIDVGIFTGFIPNTKDLEALENDTTLPIARYEITGRSIVFYLDQISSKEPVCFWFKIAREFIVSNLESSVVRVYDYYEPEHACSEFYRPDKKEAIIRTVCTGSVCTCAEGGCPAKEPFANAMEKKTSREQRKIIQEMACNEHDFFWKAKVESKRKEKTGFWTYSFRIHSVLKEGTEKKRVLDGQVREFLARGNCDTANLQEGSIYLIMGRDQEPILQENGIKKYVYFIDKTTRLHEWLELRKKKRLPASKERLQKHFINLERQFISKSSCD